MTRPASDREGVLELTRCAAGDHDAFERLYRIFAARVLGLARTLVRDPTLAEDVTQEVFSELWGKADRFDPAKGSAIAWIMTLTRSRSIDRIRGTQLSRCRDNNWANVQGTRDTDTVVESVLLGLDHQEVRSLLATLTDVQHQAIVLTYFHGLSSAQIGLLLGIPRNTVKTRTRDGLLRIRGQLTCAG